MKLHSLKISGFRRIQSTEILFGDATFLIGANNAGKSTVLKAVEYLLSGKKTIAGEEYYSTIDEETKETIPVVNTITLEAEFRNLPLRRLLGVGSRAESLITLSIVKAIQVFQLPIEKPLNSGKKLSLNLNQRLESNLRNSRIAKLDKITLIKDVCRRGSRAISRA